MARHAPACPEFRYPGQFICTCGAKSAGAAPASAQALRELLADVKAALLSLNIDGVSVYEHWMDDDGSLHRRIDAALKEKP